MEAKRKIRVFLVDDHRMLRESLRHFLGTDAAIDVVGEAGDGRAGLCAIVRLKPDVVVAEATLPELNGIDLVRLLQAQVPTARVIMLTTNDVDAYVVDAVRNGAKGYITKTGAVESLREAIHAVSEGESYFSPRASTILAQHLHAGAVTTGEAALTGREREVLQLIGEGRSVVDVAQRLSISPKTARNHRDHIAGKLGCRSTADLVKHAVRLGLTSLSS